MEEGKIKVSKYNSTFILMGVLIITLIVGFVLNY